MDRKRLTLLVVAAALVGLAIWASRCADEAKQPATASAAGKGDERADDEEVVFPRDVRRPRALNKPEPSSPGKPPPRPAGTDPIQSAMAFEEGGTVFVEVNAIRHSELVEQLLACRRGDADDATSRFKETVGIDPLEDVDRVAMHDDLYAVSGFFDELKLPAEVGEPASYGDGASIYTVPNADEEGAPAYLGKVGNGLLLLGEDEAKLKAAIDRAEGRGPRPPPLPPEVMRTEIYGRITPGILQGMFGQGSANDPLIAALNDVVKGGTVRALVDDHVSMSLDLETTDAEKGQDLAKAIGGALAGARQRAIADGREDLARLLDDARVLPGDGGKLGVDLAVPGEVILEAMGCVEK